MELIYKTKDMICRWWNEGINRKSFILVYALMVVYLAASFSDPHHYSILEHAMLGAIVVFICGNILGLTYTVLIDLYYIGALYLNWKYDYETYHTDDSLYGIYPDYVNLLEGIYQCVPMTVFMLVYLGGSILRCRNMGVRWFWGLVPLYNPIVLFFMKWKPTSSLSQRGGEQGLREEIEKQQQSRP